jgi:hypothetical protein
MDAHLLMVCCVSRQRSRDEFATLLPKSAFEFERVINASLPISIVEGVAA